MNWDAIGAIGEVLGAIAVVVTLIYLALQVRQNTDALKLGTAHNTTTELADVNLFPSGNHEIADIFLRGLEDIEDLERVERLRLYGYFHKYCRTQENVHYQFTHNALEAELFEGITIQFISVMSMPGPRHYWQARKYWYNQKFQVYVDQQLSSPALKPFKLTGR